MFDQLKTAALRIAAASTLTIMAISAPGASAAPPVDVSSYDALSDEQLGVSNRVVHIATQPPGEWYGMGIASSQSGDEGYRWQIGWWLQPLAVTQYRLSAYRELYKGAFEGFLDKMAHRDSWGYWEEMSTGMAANDSLGLPGREKPSADPIARDNINYSANTMNLMSMHQMFYRDGKYLKPNSFVLKHFTRDGFEAYGYDLPKVAHAIAAGFEETGGLGVACEVNGIYPAYCNQLAMLAFKQYDQVVPGDLGARIISQHEAAWLKTSDLYKMGAHDHAQHQAELFIPRGLNVKEGTLMAMGDTLMTSAGYLHAWKTDYVTENYRFWKNRFSISDDVITVKLDPDVRTLDGKPVPMKPRKERAAGWDTPGRAEYGETPAFYYYAAISAAEMGDGAYLAAVQKHAAKFGNQPRWKDNEYYYERNELSGPARMSRGGSVLMTAALLVEKDGIWKVYNRPWTEADARTPQLEGIAWPEILVRRAVFDKSRDALVFTLLNAGTMRGQSAAVAPTEFSISYLDPKKSYAVTRDGQAVGTVRRGVIVSGHDAMTWSAGRLALKATIGSDTSYVIQAVSDAK